MGSLWDLYKQVANSAMQDQQQQPDRRQMSRKNREHVAEILSDKIALLLNVMEKVNSSHFSI